MPKKRIASEPSLPTQVQQMRAHWEVLMQLQPRLQATLPTALAQAREKLRRDNPTAPPESEKVLLFAFYRLAALLRARSEPMTMREVSQVLDMPLSSATRWVDTLVQNGFIERLPDPQDRRVVRITLTAMGKTLHETAVEFFDRGIAEFLSHFDASERAQLLTLLAKSVRILSELHPHSSARSYSELP